jgi:hypothetical protein
MNVKIFKPSKSAMQSGHGKGEDWLLEYESETARKPEALMGWTESGDTLNQVSLKFVSLEDAVAFATRKGWNYTVLPPRSRKVKPRNYGDNFRYIPPSDQQKA